MEINVMQDLSVLKTDLGGHIKQSSVVWGRRSEGNHTCSHLGITPVYLAQILYKY